MKINRKSAVRWVGAVAAIAVIFTGGWFIGHGTAREVVTDPSPSCLASSQYGRVVLARERQGRLILLNQEEYSDEKVRELYEDSQERKQKATVLWNSFENKCQKDLQEYVS